MEERRAPEDKPGEGRPASRADHEIVLAEEPPRRMRRTRWLAGGAGALVAVLGVVALRPSGGTPPPLPLLAGADGKASGSSGAPMAESANRMAASADMAIAGPMAPMVVDYRFEGDDSHLPERAAAYQLRPRSFDRDTLADLARTVGLEGRVVEESDSLRIEGTGGYVSAYHSPTGTWWVDFGAPQAYDRPAADVPSAGEAERIARQLLGRLGALEGTWKATVTDSMGGYGVSCAEVSARLAEMAPVKGVSPAGTATDPAVAPPPPDYPACSPVETEPTLMARLVTFAPVLDGAVSDWNAWSVQIGERGRVVSVNGPWVTIERLGEYPLLSPAAALERLTSGWGQPAPVPLGAPEPARKPDLASDAPAVAPPDAPTAPVGTPMVKGDVATPAAPRPLDPATSPGVPAVADGADGAEPTVDVAPLPVPTPGMASEPAIACSSGPVADDASAISSCYAPPQPTSVTFTRAELVTILLPGYRDGRSFEYLVPAYRYSTADDSLNPWGHGMTALAVDDDSLAPVAPPIARDLPLPADQVDPAVVDRDGMTVDGSAGSSGSGSAGSSGGGATGFPGVAPEAQPAPSR